MDEQYIVNNLLKKKQNMLLHIERERERERETETDRDRGGERDMLESSRHLLLVASLFY